MKIAFITRSTIHEVQGGDAIQTLQTAKHLRDLGVEVTVFLAHEKINYDEFDLLHFFDIIRPANILFHIRKTKKPFVISPILVDYTEYDKQHRKGFSGAVFRKLPDSAIEYVKTVSRWVLGKDKLQSKTYILKGHQPAIREILDKASMLLPNSQAEYEKLRELCATDKRYMIVPNGIDEDLFHYNGGAQKDMNLVVCAARIEGIKNQYNLIRALNGTEFNLLLIGDPSPNQKKYYQLCKKIAGDNIKFIDAISQQELVSYYRSAKVHVLPSWFETCGLSSLEAAAMGCNLVISDKGFVKDYFGGSAFYCDPGNKDSIYDAIASAAKSEERKELREKILQSYTWRQAAIITLEAYKTLLHHARGCPLCNEKKYKVIHKNLEQYPAAMIVKCAHCDHIYTWLDHEPETDNLYNDEVYRVVENRDSLFDRVLNWQYKKVVKKISSLKPKGRLLDFGCGKGKFGWLAKQKGWEVKCVETSVQRAEYAGKVYGLEVDTRFYKTGRIFNDEFDVITLFHVLEHLPQPQKLFAELVKYNLSKDGLAVIEVPNVKSLQARIAGSKWLHWDVPRHVSHFTPAQLDDLAANAGFKTIKTTFFSFHLGVLGMVDSLLKLAGYKRHIIYDLKNKRSPLLVAFITVLLPFAFVLEAGSAIFGYGGITRKYLSRKECE